MFLRAGEWGSKLRGREKTPVSWERGREKTLVSWERGYQTLGR